MKGTISEEAHQGPCERGTDARDNERIRAVAILMSRLLGIGAEEADMLAERWWRRVLRTRANWQDGATMSLDRAVARACAFPSSQLRMLRELDLPDSRGLVLATIHMGDYLAALLAIATALRPRPLIIVRRRPVSERDAAVFRKLVDLGIDAEVVVSSRRTTALRLMRRVARGGVAVMFYDLPSGFGPTAPVDFLGQRLHWVEGPVRVAAATGALLLPFSAFEHPERQREWVEFAPAVSFEGPNTPASQRTAVLRWMAAFAESAVRAHPDQWLHWSQLPEMASLGTTRIITSRDDVSSAETQDREWGTGPSPRL